MTRPTNLPNDSFKHFIAWLVALFLVVVGAQLWVVQLYGSPLPMWDQWFEADLFFRPWVEGHLTWEHFVAPFNEHRILFTRLLDLGLIRLNGRLGADAANDGQRVHSRGLCLRAGLLPVGFSGAKKRMARLFSPGAIFRAALCRRKRPLADEFPAIFHEPLLVGDPGRTRVWKTGRPAVVVRIDGGDSWVCLPWLQVCSRP